MNSIKLTIFTPVYNRSKFLPIIFKSLLKQKNHSFEWIVVDDGSTDNPAEFFNDMVKNNNYFPIKFIRIKHGGKHRAINKAVSLARGNLFLILDSDDYLNSNAVNCIIKIADTIKNTKKEKFAGICGPKHHFNGTLVGTTFSNAKYLDITNFERAKNGISGDKTEVFFTSVLKKYPFPEFVNEFFLTEATVWNRMSHDGYLMRYFNEEIYYCEYKPDGLTNNITEITLSSPKGQAQYIREKVIFLEYNIFNTYKEYFSYYQLFKSKFSLVMISKFLQVNCIKLSIIILIKHVLKYFKHFILIVKKCYKQIVNFVRCILPYGFVKFIQNKYVKLESCDIDINKAKKMIRDTNQINILYTRSIYIYARTLRNIIIKKGIKCKMFTPHEICSNHLINKFYVVLAPYYFPKMPDYYVCYNFEQTKLSDVFTPDNYIKLNDSIAIFDYSINNILYLKKKLKYKNLYYMPMVPHFLCPKNQKKDIDILFYGWVNGRRKKILSKLSEDFTIKIVENVFYKTMADLLKRTKIVINIHSNKSSKLEVARIFESLSYGCFVISEKGKDTSYKIFNKDVVEFVKIGDVVSIKKILNNCLNNKKIIFEKYEVIKKFANLKYTEFENKIYSMLNKLD